MIIGGETASDYKTEVGILRIWLVVGDGDNNNRFGRPSIITDGGASERQTLGIDIGRRSWRRGLAADRSWVETLPR